MDMLRNQCQNIRLEVARSNCRSLDQKVNCFFFITFGVTRFILEISDMEAQVEKLTVKKDHVPKKEFIPAHKEFNKKVLKFIVYFKETVYESPLEHYRVRIVDLYYYLEVNN